MQRHYYIHSDSGVSPPLPNSTVLVFFRLPFPLPSQRAHAPHTATSRLGWLVPYPYSHARHSATRWPSRTHPIDGDGGQGENTGSVSPDRRCNSSVSQTVRTLFYCLDDIRGLDGTTTALWSLAVRRFSPESDFGRASTSQSRRSTHQMSRTCAYNILSRGRVSTNLPRAGRRRVELRSAPTHPGGCPLHPCLYARYWCEISCPTLFVMLRTSFCVPVLTS